jgi:hypothetical protein
MPAARRFRWRLSTVATDRLDQGALAEFSSLNQVVITAKGGTDVGPRQ